jgi:mono/diheme cytochrome c family protein
MSKRIVIAILFVLSLAALLAACTPNPQPEALTPIPTLAPSEAATLVPALQEPGAGGTSPAGQADAAQGAQIFQQNCSACHGVQGEGGIGPALRDSQYIQTAGDQAITETIANGRPGTAMPAWLQSKGGLLTDAQIANVIAFLHTLQGAAAAATPATAQPSPTDTPAAATGATPEPARPSNPGGPGEAATLIGDVSRGEKDFSQICAACHGPQGTQGIPNPGSDDDSVPTLNPIDSTIANADPKIFATNVDLFVQHGSTPAGSKPQISMPSFGDSGMLTQQQIADLIAYVMHLNGVEQK